MFKSIFDKTLALFLIILFSPIYIVVSLLIFLKMGSPILFRQKRPGYKEKIFGIYKFRTMTNEKDANGNLLPDDKRLVGIGKFIRSTSLDELPQLFNVLKGDMSLVGPRPTYDYEIVQHLKEYPKDKRFLKQIYTIRPGITGIWQVSGRNNIKLHDRFKMDAKYVREMNFLIDLKILLKTPFVVITRKGAYE